MISKLYVFENYDSLIAALAQRLSGKTKGLEGKNYVFTEEKATLIVERALLAQAGGTFNTRVFSMRKFLKTLSGDDAVLSKEGSVMLLRKIVAENADALVCLRKSRLKSLAPAAYELIAQLKSAKVDCAALSAAAESADGLLREKLTDLALLYDRYESAVEGKYLDDNNYLAKLPSLAENGVAGADVYVAAFASFTRQETDVLESFFRHAESVTAFLADGDNSYVYTGEAVAAYLRAAKRAGCVTEVIRVRDEINFGRFVIGAMFDPGTFLRPPVEAKGKIFLYEAGSETEEAEHIAAVIKRDVIEGKIRYRDAEVSVGALSPYVLRKVFREYEIPFFLDEKRTLADHVAAKLILSLFRCLRRGFLPEDMLFLAKNPLVLPEKKFADDFENYALRFACGRSSYFRPFRYGREEENFACFEKAREKIASLFSGLKRKMRAEDYIAHIRNVLAALDAEEKIAAIAAGLEDAGYREESAFVLQGYKKFSDVLIETESILKGYTTEVDEFTDVLSSGFSACEISILPQNADAVYVGNFKETRLVRAKYLFLAGMTSDIPSVKEDVAMLSDADLDRLENLKISVEPKISAVNFRERENAALAAGTFSERLYVSYAVVGAGGKPQLKSEMFRYLTAGFTEDKKALTLFNAAQMRSLFLHTPAGTKRKLDAMKYLSKTQAEKEFAKEIGRDAEDLTAASAYYGIAQGREKEHADAALASANSALALRLKTQKDIVLRNKKLSASVLQSYFNCPYKNFLTNGLGLTERKEGGAQAADIGNYLHAVFEAFAPLAKTFRDEEEAAAAAQKMAEEKLAGEEYESMAESAAGEYLLARLKEEAEKYCRRIYRQYADSDFEFLGEEVRFGKGARYGAIPLHTGGKTYYIEGKVDRIDRFKEYIRIVDYKTGSYGNTDKDFYVGKDLQTYLYMNAFTGEYRPAGVYYCGVSDDYVRDAEKQAAQFDGHTLLSEDVIFASDKNLNVSGTRSPLTGIRIGVKKSGEIKYSGKLLSEEELSAYLEYALLISEKGARRMEEGVIVASPGEGACDFCPYGGMCPFTASTDEARHTPSVNKETICAAVKSEKGEDDGT